MLSRSSLTSWSCLVAAAFALIGCGAGDPAGQASASGSRQLAVTASATADAPAVAAGTIRMHYHRIQGDTAQWGVYSWDGPRTPSAAWITDRFMFSNTDSFGGWVDIPLAAGKTGISFLVTDGNGSKSCETDQYAALNADIATRGQEIWMQEGDCTVYAAAPALNLGNLAGANAHWLTATTLAWPGVPSGGSYKLFYAANGGLAFTSNGPAGVDASFDLSLAALPDSIRAKYPHLAGATGLRLADKDAARLAELASGQFAIAQYDAAGKLVQATSLQTAGMLDEVFAANAAQAELGLSFQRGMATFRVWAPTAKSVSLNVYTGADAASVSTYPMKREAASGVWSFSAPSGKWVNRAYYTYTVNVLSRWAGNKVVANTVTDPYSVSLSANSARSFMADLDSQQMKPSGWDADRVPALAHPADIALYELHIRDFSAMDESVPAAHRGKYLAFTDGASNGMRHLKSLAKAGMTHVHLLPSFDFASVNETGCSTPAIPAGAPDGTTQQAAVAATQDSDCFNWGYDPVHYNAPEGSYASDANDGAVRVREFRAMVQALHAADLRVTLDVVYNHTSQAQQGNLSVLDRIVPAYYYRLNAGGGILGDSCCSDTAQENTMMGKLIIDSASLWARQYKVDSFRFDIMGLSPLDLMKRLQIEVNKAAGRDIYLYGEAWNTGTVANDVRFPVARQANLYGTGIGSFNDRMRDTMHGGGCCENGSGLISQQGFINGVYTDPNGQANQTRDDALRLADLARVTLAGTLRDYRFTDRTGTNRSNAEIDYFGQRAGFAANPSEIINYVEAHDGQTLFDINAMRLPQSTSLADRVRMQNLGAAIVLLSQGIPFTHAGQEILRSKSLTRDTYNAGDWFNRLDYSYQTNNFGVGLPLAGNEQSNWSLMQPVLANPLIKPDTRAILQARDVYENFLAIRKDSTLFRMRSAQDVIERLKFHNVGPDQVPGLVVMSIDGASPRPYQGAGYARVVVLFNVDKVAKRFAIPELKGKQLALHGIQRGGADEVVKTSAYDQASGTFSVPARSAAVFVQQDGGVAR